MSESGEWQYAKEVLRLDVWTRADTFDYNTFLRECPMSVGATERGLLELERTGNITREGDNYTITTAGRTAREALLAG